MFDGPVTYGIKKLTDHLQEGMIDFVVDFITVFPILAVVSLGVYALVGMLSKRLANAGVMGVFVYGALVIIV